MDLGRECPQKKAGQFYAGDVEKEESALRRDS